MPPARGPRRSGWSGSCRPTEPSKRHEAFREDLRKLGWVEGQNLKIEFRFAGSKPDRLAALAEELVRMKPDEQPQKFEMVINLKTARRLGLCVPRGMLLKADRVVE